MGDSEKLTDPESLLDNLAKRYRTKKTMYRRASEWYFNLNTFLFFLPILVITGVATVLTHIAAVLEAQSHSSNESVSNLAISVSALEGVCLIWHTAQMKMGWVEKTSLAEKAMMNYRSLSLLIDHLKMLLHVQDHPKTTSGILTVVKTCYQEESKVLKNDASVPKCVYRDYRREKPQAMDSVTAELVSAPIDSSDDDDDDDNATAQKEERRDEFRTAKINLAQERDERNRKHKMKMKSSAVEDFRHQIPDESVDVEQLLSLMRRQYWRKKNMFFDAAKEYWLLTSLCFYLPVLSCHMVAAVVPILMDIHSFIASLVVIVANVLAGTITGVQAKILWEKQSLQNEEAYQLYRTLESEASYRLLLTRQGIKIKEVVHFTWQCKDFELRLLTSLPAIPQRLYKRWANAEML